jgi:hypothetical protein
MFGLAGLPRVGLPRRGVDQPITIAQRHPRFARDPQRDELRAIFENVERIRGNLERDRLRPMVAQLRADFEAISAKQAEWDAAEAARAWYAPVPAEQVRADTRRLAEWAAAKAGAELYLPPVSISWFTPVDGGARREGAAVEAGCFWFDEPCLGFAERGSPETIWLNRTLQDQPVVDLYRVVGHELRHLDQFRNSRAWEWEKDSLGLFRASMEADASAYGQDFAARLCAYAAALAHEGGD